MQGQCTKAAQIVTAAKPEVLCSYKTGNSGACKTWHGGPHGSAKGGRDKGGTHTIT